MPHKHHNNTLTAILLAMLMLATTACATTNQTTITAPADETPGPGDTTPSPGDTTPATPTTEPPTSELSPESTPAIPDQILFTYPDHILTNLSDRSTSLGRLCWAIWEFLRTGTIEFFNILAESPKIEIVDPDVSGIMDNEDGTIGPTGITNEEIEEPTSEADAYGFWDALEAIQEPYIATVVDDPGLSEELQEFAKAFFEMIEAIEEQAKVVGYGDIDYSQLTYKDLESLPNADVYEKAATENPTQCRFPSNEDNEGWLNQIETLNNISD